jgi:hypothetical protein
LLLLLGCVFAVLVIAHLLFRLTASSQRINEESFDDIQSGMTEGEVEAVVGAPAGIYAPTPRKDGAALVTDLYTNNCDTVWGPVVPKRWQGKRGILVVVFDPGGRVVDKFFAPWESDESLLAKLRRWLGFGS